MSILVITSQKEEILANYIMGCRLVCDPVTQYWRDMPPPQKHNMPKNAKNAQKTNAAKYKNKKGSALVLEPILVLELVLRLVLK